MKWFLDTEFYERPNRIDVISVGLVSSQGDEWYAENSEFDWAMMEALAHHPSDEVAGTPNWLLENVHPHLTGDAVHPNEMARQIKKLVGNKPEFWGWYCDYDWVGFCWLFGRMIDLPKGFPMFCRDLRQRVADLHVDPASLPKQESTEHNALDDARWNRQVYEHLKAHSAPLEREDQPQ